MPLSHLDEKYRVSSCTICLIRNSDTPISLAMVLINLLGSLPTIAWISQKNSGVIFFQNNQREISKLLYFYYQHWTHQTVFESSNWHPNIEIFELAPQAWTQRNAVCRSKFLSCIMVLFSSQTVTQLTLLCCTVDKIYCMREISNLKCRQLNNCALCI